jgi:cobyrinic acid a,c-diamide synthase
MLEARGATVVDFSPLHDEHLPPGCDIVLLGGGHAERHASTLADNHCMKTALRNHIRWGRRIYGEGGGAAFLCQQMVTPDGQLARMAGLLPAIARAIEPSGEHEPVEGTFARANWLGHAGIRIRGYRNPCWAIEPLGQSTGLLADERDSTDMVGTFQTVGSLLEVHFGAQANVLNHFFYPHKPNPPDEDPWKHS